MTFGFFGGGVRLFVDLKLNSLTLSLRQRGDTYVCDKTVMNALPKCVAYLHTVQVAMSCQKKRNKSAMYNSFALCKNTHARYFGRLKQCDEEWTLPLESEEICKNRVCMLCDIVLLCRFDDVDVYIPFHHKPPLECKYLFVRSHPIPYFPRCLLIHAGSSH